MLANFSNFGTHLLFWQKSNGKARFLANHHVCFSLFLLAKRRRRRERERKFAAGLGKGKEGGGEREGNSLASSSVLFPHSVPPEETRRISYFPFILFLSFLPSSLHGGGGEEIREKMLL